MDATEQTFDWTYSEDGIVQVRDTRYREDPSNVTSPVILEHKLTPSSAGLISGLDGSTVPAIFQIPFASVHK